MGAEQVPTLGQVLKGARLGWHWLEGVGFVLVADLNDDQFLIDVRPATGLPRANEHETHRVWWANRASYHAIEQVVRRKLFGGLLPRGVRRPVQFTARGDEPA